MVSHPRSSVGEGREDIFEESLQQWEERGVREEKALKVRRLCPEGKQPVEKAGLGEGSEEMNSWP